MNGAARKVTPRGEGLSRLILDGILDAVLVADASGRVVSCNLAAQRVFGYKLKEVQGREIGLLIPQFAEPEAFLERQSRREVLGARKNGSSFTADLALNRITMDGQLFTVGIIRDITEFKQAMDEFRHTATHDYLTDLPNRFLMHDRLEQAMGQAQRTGTTLAVMFLDLDNFKHINDGFGHQVGDKLLKAVAGRLQSCVRETDTVARLGGDEFAVIETNLSRRGGAARLAKKIIDAISEPLVVDGQRIETSPSIGVTIYPDRYGEADPDQLLKRADMAMYEAKASGKRTYSIYDQGMDASAAYRLTMPTDIRRALKQKEFLLLYQPQVDLNTGAIVAVEALIRWNHPTRGLLAPGDFLEVAESGSLVESITDWVMTEACTQLSRWLRLDAPSPVKRIAINVSPVELKQEGLAARLQGIVTAAGIQPCRVEIEFSERSVTGDIGAYDSAIRDLHAKGFRIGLDNFGSGFSSLGALASLPISSLKIDGALVASIGSKAAESTEETVKAVVGLGSSLSKAVVAEGIETEEQFNYLRANGCAYGQGFLFSHPLSEEAILRVLQEGAGGLRKESPPYALR